MGWLFALWNQVSDWLISFPNIFYIFLIALDHQCSFLCSSFLRLVLVLQISSPLFFLQMIFRNPSSWPLTSNLICFSYKFTMNCFSFHCLCLSSSFCFIAVATDPSYSGKILPFLDCLNNLSSDWAGSRERFCSSVSTQSVMLNSPHPLSILGMYSLSVSLWGCYIPLIAKNFPVFLSITFSSYFAHFSISELYLTKDTARKFIALIVFPPFIFDEVSRLTLL